MNNTETNPNAPAAAPGLTRGKTMATYLSLAMIGAVLWPIQENWRDKPRDSFPLSYYPMFSTKRDPIETFQYMVGLDAEDNRYYLPYKMAGPGGLNSVRRQIRRIVNEGRAPELAHHVAQKLRRKDELPWSKIVTVQVMRGKFSVDDFFHGKKQPVSETIKGSAPVERKS